MHKEPREIHATRHMRKLQTQMRVCRRAQDKKTQSKVIGFALTNELAGLAHSAQAGAAAPSQRFASGESF
jgi:hypothetical protein